MQYDHKPVKSFKGGIKAWREAQETLRKLQYRTGQRHVDSEEEKGLHVVFAVFQRETDNDQWEPMPVTIR